MWGRRNGSPDGESPDVLIPCFDAIVNAGDDVVASRCLTNSDSAKCLWLHWLSREHTKCLPTRQDHTNLQGILHTMGGWTWWTMDINICTSDALRISKTPCFHWIYQHLPASTSIYQHLPAFGEGASPASSSTSGMPSNGQRVGIPWNTWIRRAQLGQLGQYSDWKRCHALHVSLLCMLLSNAVIQRIGNSVYQCLMMSQVWHIKQTLKCESWQIWRTRSENIRNLQIVLQVCDCSKIVQCMSSMSSGPRCLGTISWWPQGDRIQHVSTCLNMSHNLCKNVYSDSWDMMD